MECEEAGLERVGAGGGLSKPLLLWMDIEFLWLKLGESA
jgi:hypothetical protein